MIAAALAGLLAGYGIAIPVGAVGAYLVALSARAPRRVGTAAALGVATVDGGYALLAVLGGGALVPLVEPMAAPLRWVSAAVLVLLAARISITAVRAGAADGNRPVRLTPARAYAGLVAMTAINPTTVVYFAAIVLGNQADLVDTTPQRLLFVTAAALASASWQLLLSTAGALLGRALTGRRGRLATAFASSAIIVLLAVHTALR
ncbi:LysE family transporter [Saccharopolyspora griseoalba]|uniref:LysE family transporter n=1 Tax=Saccharopolyspora griseoalba TaxID=1431848 RepID=A0ABW2LHB5_9PSEU